MYRQLLLRMEGVTRKMAYPKGVIASLIDTAMMTSEAGGTTLRTLAAAYGCEMDEARKILAAAKRVRLADGSRLIDVEGGGSSPKSIFRITLVNMHEQEDPDLPLWDGTDKRHPSTSWDDWKDARDPEVATLAAVTAPQVACHVLFAQEWAKARPQLVQRLSSRSLHELRTDGNFLLSPEAARQWLRLWRAVPGNFENRVARLRTMLSAFFLDEGRSTRVQRHGGAARAYSETSFIRNADSVLVAGADKSGAHNVSYDDV